MSYATAVEALLNMLLGSFPSGDCIHTGDILIVWDGWSLHLDELMR